MNLFLLFAEFVKIGLFSIGGGLATLPFLFQLANRYAWLSPEKVGDLLAVAQSSQGAIGINMAAQAGFRASGVIGAAAAALGTVAPSVVIIIAAARFLQVFKSNKIVGAVFAGLRPAAAGLLAAAGFGAWKIALYNSSWQKWFQILRWRECLILIAVFIALRKFKLHPAVYIVSCGALGIVSGL
jgi:chromate transporter